jgi:hypothetical protein
MSKTVTVVILNRTIHRSAERLISVIEGIPCKEQREVFADAKFITCQLHEQQSMSLFPTWEPLGELP